MQIDISLEEPFSYSFLPIILLFICLLLPFIWKFLKKYIKLNKTKQEEVYNYYMTKDMYTIKFDYLNKLDKLESDLGEGKITSRKAYQELSMLIRLFVYELTGIEVQSYTLKEIKKLKISVLYELVKEYYDPEFSKISKGNITSSINKTRGVIKRWR